MRVSTCGFKTLLLFIFHHYFFFRCSSKLCDGSVCCIRYIERVHFVFDRITEQTLFGFFFRIQLDRLAISFYLTVCCDIKTKKNTKKIKVQFTVIHQSVCILVILVLIFFKFVHWNSLAIEKKLENVLV